MLTCSNAGHEYPFIRGKDGAFHQYEDKHGFVVGGLKKMKYTDYELMLKPGGRHLRLYGRRSGSKQHGVRILRNGAPGAGVES